MSEHNPQSLTEEKEAARQIAHLLEAPTSEETEALQENVQALDPQQEVDEQLAKEFQPCWVKDQLIPLSGYNYRVVGIDTAGRLVLRLDGPTGKNLSRMTARRKELMKEHA